MILLVAAALLSPPADIDVSNLRHIESWDPTPDCREWTQARRQRDARAAAMEGWVVGLIAGYNLYNANRHSDLLRGSSRAEAFAWIDRRCAAEPNRAMVEIATELVDDLRGRARPGL